jgi:hypothetical protein
VLVQRRDIFLVAREPVERLGEDDVKDAGAGILE